MVDEHEADSKKVQEPPMVPPPPAMVPPPPAMVDATPEPEVAEEAKEPLASVANHSPAPPEPAAVPAEPEAVPAEPEAVVAAPVEPEPAPAEPPSPPPPATAASTPSPAPTTPPPLVTAVRPVAGPLGGGTRVTVEGTGFADGCEVKLGGVPVTATFESTTALAFTTLPRNLPGAVDVDVKNPDGQRTMLLRSFEYCAAPSLASIEPDHAPETGKVRVTLTGAELREGSEVRLGASRPAVEYRGPTRVELLVEAHPAGTVDVELVAPDGQTARLPAAFRFDGPPRVDRVVPDRGAVGESLRVHVEGDGFRTGCVVYLGGARLAADVESATRLVATVPSHDAPGTHALRVQNVDGLGAELASAFHVEAGPGPRIAMLVPQRGPRGRETAVGIVGQRFDAGCSVRVAGAPVAAKLVSPERLEVTLPPLDRLGWIDVTVTAADGRAHTLDQAFELRGAPQLQAVQPREGSDAGGAWVTLVGLGFERGCEVSFGGFPAKSDWESESCVKAVVPSRSAGAGTVDVLVRNPDEQSATLSSAFTYVARKAPVIASVEPAKGPTTGGTGVLLQGEHLDAVTVVLVGGLKAANFKARGGELGLVTPPRGREGAVDLELRTADGMSVVRKNAFTYEPVPAPVIQSVTPNRGAPGGGTEVTIAGEHFFAGATVLVDGEPAKTTKVRDRSTIVFTAPPGENGVMVDVVVRSPTGQEGVAKRAFLYDARYA
ncbi:MAG TPA: IPT/TIG domain-containing protein [Polyangiaceae bacterium]|jgi:hypothetical protein